MVGDRMVKPHAHRAGTPNPFGVVALVVCALAAGSCRQEISPDSPLGARVSLVGAGAGFPAMLYQSWAIALYTEMPELKINYQSMGSGAGVKQVIKKVVDFGGSDMAMTDEEIAQTKDGVLLLPMTAGAVVLAYNIPGLDTQLRLSRETYTGILLGRIDHWRDPAIVADNPGATLPDLPITVVHRSDGAGSTAVLTAHLAEISEEWAATIGIGKNVDWPRTGRFFGTKGNDGVVMQILQLPGTIGYLDYAFAANNDVGLTALENRAGNFVAPTHTAAEASLGMSEMPPDMRLFITDPDGPDSYPVVTYTWLLVYRHYKDPLKAKAMEIFIEYGLNEGQEVAPVLGYAPLPDKIRESVAAIADGISPDYDLNLEPGGEQ
jgi:phosphate transport system substrate-binding protein